MGKKGASSWLTAVKRAFRSPTKDNQDKGRNCRRKENHLDPSSEDHDDDHRKKERRRWLFKKGSNQQEQSIGSTQQSDTAEQQHAVAVAVATAAVAAAQAAIKTGKITKSSPANVNNRQHIAAIVIQTAFRGYLARRALKALKGLVKLQALVRGHNVRKQAKMTLKCMQALVRVQSRVLDQRMRLSHEGSRKSTFSDTNSLLESRYFHDLAERRSVSHSREASSIDDWDERPHTIEEVKAMLQSRKEAAFKREKSLSHAFTQQIWRSDRSSLGEEGEETIENRPRWLDRWMATKPWDSTTGAPGIRARASTDHRDTIKTVEIDTAQPYSYLTSAPNFRRSTTAISSQFQSHQYPNSSYQRPSSPLHTRGSHNQTQVTTPSPSSARTIQVRSASPRCGREDRSYNCNVSQTPSLRSNYYNYNNGRGVSSNNVPNYMIATESAKARVRSQSAPRQRPLTPERDRDRDRAGVGPKKRLSYPNLNPDPYGGSGYGGANLRSPSFKSVIEQQSNYSCCTDSLGGEISPSSTSDLRRWLR